MRKYFGTDGIRRIANTQLTPELVYKVAKAAAYVLSKNTDRAPEILIGRDTRLSGTLIESAMCAGFLSYGANVKLLGVIPTPAVAYLTKKLNADAGVVISASHNTFEYNGIKFFSNKGMKIPDEIEEEIEEIIDSDKINDLIATHEKIGTYEYREDLVEEYLFFLRKNFDGIDSKKLKVVIDVANGATYMVAENIFKKLGFDVKILNNEPDGININSKCGSTHLEELQKYVKENDVDIAIAYDGDGDRCLALDEKGNICDGDKILAILSKYLKEQGKLNKDTIVATVMSNLGLKKYVEKNNLKLEITSVGDRYVLENMLENGFNLGGEQSGHIILLEYNPTGDGIFTSLMLISAMLKENKKLSDLSEIKIYPQVLQNVKVELDKKDKYLENEKIKEEIEKIENKYKGDGRVLIRPSGTEPLVRVMIEGEDIDEITNDAKYLCEIIDRQIGIKN